MTDGHTTPQSPICTGLRSDKNGPARCESCGYCLNGLGGVAPVCPECGVRADFAAIRREKQYLKQQRRQNSAALLGPLMAYALANIAALAATFVGAIDPWMPLILFTLLGPGIGLLWSLACLVAVCCRKLSFASVAMMAAFFFAAGAVNYNILVPFVLPWLG